MLMPGFDIVEKQRGDMVVSHRMIAEYTEVDEKAIRNIINKYYDDFVYFGSNQHPHFKNATVNQQLSFKIITVTNSVGAVNKQKTYLLNEQQATLLMTYLKNSPIVREFKVRMVEEFFIMRNEIMHQLKYTKEGKNRMMSCAGHKGSARRAQKRVHKLIDENERLRNSNNYLDSRRWELVAKNKRLEQEIETIKSQTKNFRFGGVA